MQHKINKAFNEILMTPFSSASACYRLICRNTQDIGYDCYEQAMRLREELKPLSEESFYLCDEVKQQHHALIIRSQGLLYLLEPYLLHTSPIEIPKQDFQKSFPALPYEHNARIKIKTLGEKLIIKRINSPKQTQFRDETFSYDKEKRILEEINEDQYKRIVLRNRIQPIIRTIDRDLKIRQLFYFPKRNCFKSSYSPSGISNENTVGFKRDIEAICLQTNISEKELKEHLAEAYEIWIKAKNQKESTT